MLEIKATPGNHTLYGTSATETFVFNDVSDYFMYPSASQSSYEVHVSSADGYHIIKNFDLYANDFDRISSIDPETQNSEHLPMKMDVVAPGSMFKKSEETEDIFGTTGSDSINGTSADEIIRSLSGDDIVYGNGGYNEIYGGTGDDSLYGGADSNALHGEKGNDYLKGGDYTNKLYGGAGNDTLDGSGAYSDTLIGGTGNDTYIMDDSPSYSGLKGDILYEDDPITEYSDGGTDTVESPVGYVLGDNLENLLLTGSNDSDGVGNVLDNQINGNVGKNFLVGGDGNDELRGNKGDDILAGVTGNVAANPSTVTSNNISKNNSISCQNKLKKEN